MKSTTNTPAPAPTVYLVAIDGSSSSARVLEVACGLGAALGGAAELHILHVLPSAAPTAMLGMAPLVKPTDFLDAGRSLLDDASEQAAARFGGRILGHLGCGDACREITRTAANLRADLVVVGTAGKTGLVRLALGSVAEKVVRTAGCPVLVVRPKDFHGEGVPEIEPPCADCVAVQTKTARAQLWCTRHSTHHVHGNLHYEVPPTFAVGSMLLRP